MPNKHSERTTRKKIVRGMIRTLTVFFLISTIIVVIAGVTPPAVPITPSGHKQFESVYVSMEDGTRIAVRIALPPDLKPGERISAILEMTRHSTDVKPIFLLNVILKFSGDIKANLKIGHTLMEAGYAYIRVDARGTNASFGSRESEWSREEINDFGQVMDWVTRQPWSNGRVGTYGVSYSGNTAELVAALNHPSLVAAALLYSDFEPIAHNAMPGGILNAYLIENWSESMTIDDANRAKGPFSNGIAPVDDDKDEQLLNQALRERDNANLAQAFEGVTYFDDHLTEGDTAYSFGPFHYKEEGSTSELTGYDSA
jgi:putative CocE/NonD family hydrolase